MINLDAIRDRTEQLRSSETPESVAVDREDLLAYVDILLGLLREAKKCIPGNHGFMLRRIDEAIAPDKS